MIKVLHKAFDLLESMAAYKDRVFTLSELSEIIQEKPSTCANIVKTLCERGYLSRIEPKGYKLGPVARRLDYNTTLDVKLMNHARDVMEQLVRQFEATGVLSVLRRGKKKVLDDYRSDSDLVINRTIRKDRELYATSTGLVLTAFAEIPDESVITEEFESMEQYLQIRSFIQKEHYIAITIRPKVLEVAAAVFYKEQIAASVAVYLPEFLVSEAEKRTLIQAVCNAASVITERMNRE